MERAHEQHSEGKRSQATVTAPRCSLERDTQMINPWQDLFNAWIDNLGTEKKEMKQYEVKLETKATISVFVDASDEDEAIEIAYDYLDEKDAELGEWEVTDVQRDYE